MLEVLQLWPNTLILIGKLCLAKNFRDALLDVDPSFLSLLLDTFNGPNPPPAGLEDACIQMLSYPLPTCHATPASTHSLLSRLIKDVVLSPSVSTIRPLYSVITGVGTDCLKSMPGDLTTNLHKTLTRSLKSTPDHIVSLLCLAFLARLYPGLPSQPHSEDVVSEKGQVSATTSDQSRPRQLRNVLIGKMACNALELAILQAIVACSGQSNATALTSLEVLGLALVIVKAIETEDRLVWIKRSAHLIQKLHDRIFRRELDKALRLTGFELWIALTEGSQLNASDEDITIVEMIVDTFPQVTQSNRTMTTYCGRFSASFVKSQLVKALEITVRARSPCTAESMLELRSATCVIESFVDAVKVKNKLRKTILIALMSNDLRILLQQFLATESDSHLLDMHQDTDVCIAQIFAAVQMLQRKLCTLFLLSSLHSTFDDVGIDPILASNILEKVQEASIPPPKCDMFQSCSRPAIKALSLVQISGTPTKHTGNWRDRLASELSREASQAQSRTIRFIHEVCRDFEARCNDVERPLRKEQARSLELENENVRLQKEVARLTTDLLDRTSALGSVQAKELALSERLRDCEVSLIDLTTELEKARQATSDASELSKKNAEDAQEVLKNKEIEHQATLISKESLLKDHAARFSSLESSFNALKEKADSLELELSKSNETHLLLLSQRNSEVEQARRASSKQSRELDKLRHAEKEKTHELENMKREVCTLSLLLRINTNSMQMTRLQDGFNQEKAAMTGEILKLERMLGEAQHRAESSSEQHAMELASLENKIAHADREMSSISERHALEVANLEEILRKTSEETATRSEQYSLETAGLKQMLSSMEDEQASITRKHSLEVKRLEDQLKCAEDTSATASRKHADNVANLTKKVSLGCFAIYQQYH